MSHPYISIGDKDREQMLAAIGVKHLDDLFKHIPVPPSTFDFENGISEWETAYCAQSFSHLNGSTHDAHSFLGAGVYDHWYPSAVDFLVSRGEFLTAYTPYQPELSQGNLQIIYEFQSLLSRLYGMEICNASVYDGAHALVESVLMALRLKKMDEQPTTVVLTQGLHPEYDWVLRTYLRGFPQVQLCYAPLDARTGQTQWDTLASTPGQTPVSVVVGQYPNFFGVVDSIQAVSDFAKQNSALSVIVNIEPFVFGIHEPPGMFGVDIVAAELQSFGNPIAFGGPHIGAVLTKRANIRQLPGRLVGKTKTLSGDKTAYTLTLSTREQHIRREKATSNICTNQGLLVNRVVSTLCLLGEQGVREVAQQNYIGAHKAHEIWGQYCKSLFSQSEFFNEFAFVLTPALKQKIMDMRQQKTYFGVMSDQLAKTPSLHPFVLCCVTEKRLPEELERVEAYLKGTL